jgi:hypothetical protein
MYPKRISTLGSYIDDGYTISVSCNEYGCNHSRVLDLEALAGKLGRGFDMIAEHDRLRTMLRCEKCGVVGNVQFTVSPPTKGVRKEKG